MVELLLKYGGELVQFLVEVIHPGLTEMDDGVRRSGKPTVLLHSPPTIYW